MNFCHGFELTEKPVYRLKFLKLSFQISKEKFHVFLHECIFTTANNFDLVSAQFTANFSLSSDRAFRIIQRQLLWFQM